MGRQQKTARRRAYHQIIIAKGDDVRSFVLKPWMIVGSVLLGLGVTFWVVAATAYVVFRDDVLAAMMARQTTMQHAYEDRIATLRLLVDRVTSRQLIDQEGFNARIDELLRRQAALDQRNQAVQGVMERARQSGLLPAAAPATPAPAQRSDVAPAVDAITTGSIAPTDPGMRGAARAIDATLTNVDRALGQMTQSHEVALARVEQKARETETRIRSVLADLGLQPDRVAGPRPRQRAPQMPQAAAGGVGGPLLPFAAGQSGSLDAFDLRAQRLDEQFAYVEQLRRGLGVLPVRRPVPAGNEMSSNFGNRLDPFLGVPAFHAGIDFRGDTGDPVRATGAGRVVGAGRSGGFGNLVEIDHGHGLTTRYAHLSAILVREGQTVAAGQLVGRIGSTGRSTGPHLHYETRVEGEAVNPERFMRAGQRLGLW
jgi:murein DD-endopeptidase MepM/ murein hydrolase activator NlpD